MKISRKLVYKIFKCFTIKYLIGIYLIDHNLMRQSMLYEFNMFSYAVLIKVDFN